ncbi:MAG: hypothetical protein ACR2LG_03500 [Actinomycetota bacterium]
MNIKFAIYDLLGAEHPMTVRQVFYRLVSAGVVDKTEAQYKSTVCRLLTEMRLQHSEDEVELLLSSNPGPTVPYGWIADNTRWMRKPVTFSGTDDALRRTAELYRRNLWDDADAYVEVWLEKEALAGVLIEETSEYDVPLMVTRGYPSLSFVAEAAEVIGDKDKPAFLYYFGDRDPSGVDIPRHIEERLAELAPWAEIHFEKIAVTTEQIETLGLPTRPTKKSDTRSKTFVGESVEVDAIPPSTLRELVRDCIEHHIDHQRLAVLQEVERNERELLLEIAGMS